MLALGRLVVAGGTFADDVLGLGGDWRSAFLPMKTSDRALVVCAGEGTTGSTSLAKALTLAGLRVQHGSGMHPEGVVGVSDYLSTFSVDNAHTFDPSRFDELDAIADTPVAHRATHGCFDRTST